MTDQVSKRVSIRISPDLKARLKAYAVQRHQSMEQVVLDALDALDARDKAGTELADGYIKLAASFNDEDRQFEKTVRQRPRAAGSSSEEEQQQ